jgi:hypothetical protein
MATRRIKPSGQSMHEGGFAPPDRNVRFMSIVAHNGVSIASTPLNTTSFLLAV